MEKKNAIVIERREEKEWNWVRAEKAIGENRRKKTQKCLKILGETAKPPTTTKNSLAGK